MNAKDIGGLVDTLKKLGFIVEFVDHAGDRYEFSLRTSGNLRNKMNDAKSIITSWRTQHGLVHSRAFDVFINAEESVQTVCHCLQKGETKWSRRQKTPHSEIRCRQ